MRYEIHKHEGRAALFTGEVISTGDSLTFCAALIVTYMWGHGMELVALDVDHEEGGIDALATKDGDPIQFFTKRVEE
jgi:hypothetical protein